MCYKHVSFHHAKGLSTVKDERGHVSTYTNGPTSKIVMPILDVTK